MFLYLMSPDLRPGQTVIAVSVQTREELKKFGSKGDTYDLIIQRLMEEAKEVVKG